MVYLHRSLIYRRGLLIEHILHIACSVGCLFDKQIIGIFLYVGKLAADQHYYRKNSYLQDTEYKHWNHYLGEH